MNQETFVRSFGHLADAPDGIEKLRELVLELAMCGRLTTRDSGDVPADVSIDQTVRDRARWVEPTAPAKYSRRDAGYPLGKGDLPEGWTYCRLGEVLQFVNGRAYKKSEWKKVGTPVIRIQNLNGGNDYYFSDLTLKAHNYCSEGDLLFAWSASFGPYLWAGEKAIFHYHIWKVVTSPSLVRRFAYYLLEALTGAVKSASHGLAMLHMTKERMEGLVCPIPSVLEQERIVERVDRLMSLCDELEEQQAARAEARVAMSSATLLRLPNADSVDRLQADVEAFVEKIGLHLAPGKGDVAVVNRIRQSILDLAVRGRLARQDPADEPAVELLEQIAAERDRQVKAKEIRKPTRFDPIASDSVSLPLPHGWAWARGNEFFIASDSGWSPQCLIEPAGSREWGVLKTSAVSRGVFDQAANKKLPTALEPRPHLQVAPGEFVMIRASGSKSLVGRGAIVTETEAHLMLSDKHIRLSFLHQASTRYWAILNGSTQVRRYYSAESSGTSTMSNVTRDRIGAVVVPVPPLAEQLRIADTVSTLMALCDELEQQFMAAEGARRDLAASIAAHAVPSSESSSA